MQLCKTQLSNGAIRPALLEEGIRTGTPHLADVRIEGCTPKVVRHKAGLRCTLFLLGLVPSLGCQLFLRATLLLQRSRMGEGGEGRRQQ